MNVAFVIPGQPVAKGRPKFSRRGSGVVAYTATIAMREGSVVYLVNATGPRSNAVKVSAAGLLPVLVEPLVEIPQ